MKSLIQLVVGLCVLGITALSGCVDGVDDQSGAQQQSPLEIADQIQGDARVPVRRPGAMSSVSSPARQLRPLVNCVAPGVENELVAHLGYENSGAVAVTIPVGAHNAILPPPFDRGQPTAFVPGRSDNVASVSFDDHRGHLTWTLDGEHAIAGSQSPHCVPSFTGAISASALSDGEISLSWSAAGDYTTPPSNVVYDICLSTTSGQCAARFVVALTSEPGATSSTVSGLMADTRYFFVVRARNAIGNADTNHTEVNAQTCATGNGVCYGECISLGSDPANCGRCGKACASALCGAGQCCLTDQNLCSGTCTSLDSDPMNCGECGHLCPDEYVCTGGQCVGREPIAIAVGNSHSCALLREGAVECWGNNEYGQLGNGTMSKSYPWGLATPTHVPGLTGVKSITAGWNHTCALLTDSTVRCWGSGLLGQLGNGTKADSSLPATVSNLSGVTAIAAGDYHTCVLLASGGVLCWGGNSYGQLGNGTTTDSFAPVAVHVWGGVRTISAGWGYTCALLTDGTVQCWGKNWYGQLGNGTTVNSSAPVGVLGLSGVATIAAGGDHTCALSVGGAAECWGENQFGQLGNGETTNSSIPVPVSELNGASTIAAGRYHTCSTLRDGTVACWGTDTEGQLGIGAATGSSIPIPITVSGLTHAIAVAAGFQHTCTMQAGGTVACWGSNQFGQLGNGVANSSSTPVVVSGVSGIKSIGVGGGESGESGFTCAALKGEKVECWGRAFASCFDGAALDSSTLAVVSELRGSVMITTGSGHLCAMRTGGSVVCCGSNGNGQLGNGTTTSSSTPVAVLGLREVTAITSCSCYSCALTADATVVCWGCNGSGQLGNGTFVDSATPVSVSGLVQASGVAVGDYHACAITIGGTVACWGSNGSGQLGDGSGASSSTPVIVRGLDGALGVTAGMNHACALLNGGTVACWGNNGLGQLGNGSTTNSFVPVAVSGLAGATAITATGNNNCALLEDGTVACWGGINHFWDGHPAHVFFDLYASRPLAVPGLIGAVAVTTGWSHACAILAGGTAQCWGDNFFGELGNGISSVFPAPVVAKL